MILKFTLYVFSAAVLCAAGFDTDVKPVLKNTCAGCHNATLTSGGVNLLPYLDAATVTEDRPSWDKILQKITSGEMPPKGVPRPPQTQIRALSGNNISNHSLTVVARSHILSRAR